MDNILTHLGLNSPKPWVTGKAVPIENPDPTLLYGVELEIENTQGSDWVVPGITVTEDGSLRNHGYEYITAPMTLSNLSYCLNTFFRKAQVDESNYSERTSVHVHTNVGDMTFEQLASLCMLYQVFEGLLFEFIGDGRRQNIFCVPWSETTLSYRTIGRIAKNDTDAIRHWQKYTALNLLPIMTQGSVEWRHMSGTCNIERIILWCQLIGCMFAYAKANTMQQTQDLVINLNTSSAYMGVIDTVFGKYAHVLRVPGYEAQIENGVLNMKYSLLNKPEAKKYAWTPPPAFFNQAGLNPAVVNPIARDAGDELARQMRMVRAAQQELREAPRRRPIDPVRRDPVAVINDEEQL